MELFRLVVRIIGQYRYSKNEDHYWRFRLEKNTPLLMERFYIRKQNSLGTFIWPYFPCENILEDGAKYEIILTMSCIVYNPQGPVPTVYQIRPLDGSAARTYSKIKLFRRLSID